MAAWCDREDLQKEVVRRQRKELRDNRILVLDQKLEEEEEKGNMSPKSPRKVQNLNTGGLEMQVNSIAPNNQFKKIL